MEAGKAQGGGLQAGQYEPAAVPSVAVGLQFSRRRSPGQGQALPLSCPRRHQAGQQGQDQEQGQNTHRTAHFSSFGASPSSPRNRRASMVMSSN